MRDTDYAFCVARIRANETKLLSADFINKLIDAESYGDVLQMLVNVGWIASDSIDDNYIRNQSNSLWKLLAESVPDKSVLNDLCVLNDCFNIKTAVKCILSGEDADPYYSEPSSLELDRLCGSIDSRKFDVFKNETMRNAAKNAFEVACTSGKGQDAEMIVDVAALKLLLEISFKSKYCTFSEICGFIADTSNIRTAIRCAHNGKSAAFITSALSDCKKISKDTLVNKASSGSEELYDYLLSGDYSEGVKLYRENPALFDKWCERKILEIATNSRYSSFGFDPVCAYFYRKNNEIKTVKLILSAKKSGVPTYLIKERVVAYA